jgi:hypothetical protein
MDGMPHNPNFVAVRRAALRQCRSLLKRSFLRGLTHLHTTQHDEMCLSR